MPEICVSDRWGTAVINCHPQQLPESADVRAIKHRARRTTLYVPLPAFGGLIRSLSERFRLLVAVICRKAAANCRAVSLVPPIAVICRDPP